MCHALFGPFISRFHREWYQEAKGGDDRAGRLLFPPSPLLPEKAQGAFVPRAFGMFSFSIYLHHQEKGHTLAAGTLTSTDIWIAAARHLSQT